MNKKNQYIKPSVEVVVLKQLPLMQAASSNQTERPDYGRAEEQTWGE